MLELDRGRELLSENKVLENFGFRHKRKPGRLEVITGSMFSGKSEETIRRAKRAAIARQNVQVFKPKLDDRYGTDFIKSHNGSVFKAVEVENAAEIPYRLNALTEVVVIDEAQFFDQKIVSVCNELAGQNIRVIANGLDLDFRGEPFGPMPELMAAAEDVDKLHAICESCGEEASRPQRLIDGEPAPYDSPIIQIGGAESYRAACRHCHKVPGKDNNNEGD